LADPVAELSLELLHASADHRSLMGMWRKRLANAFQALCRSRPLRLASTLAGPYGPLLYEWFQTEHARTGLLTLAAHGTLGPYTPGAAFFVFWQAAYHRYGNWHARGGSGEMLNMLVCTSPPAMPWSLS
jgi:phytoene dehydrogenase-like protein